MHVANSERPQYDLSQRSYECPRLGLLRTSENSTLPSTRVDGRVRPVAITGNPHRTSPGGSVSGLLGLSLYGALTFFSSLNPQPDPNTHYEAFSRFVTTNGYVLKHLFLTILGTIFGIFGSIALGAYLTRSRVGHMGLVGMVITVLGYSLFLTWGGVSTFATPQEGQAYLAGIEQFHKLPPTLANTLQSAAIAVSVVLGFVGNVLLGVAVWRPC
jgi:hypothetical protein